ncbi:hypothetical protein [Amycolatopsis sp. cmx-8-4]|uniref:hypothetical protein n=1 Tax=Amycolatopsis sp. cmx-8-4 TaxID=2790947 RepID=UPI003978AB2D
MYSKTKNKAVKNKYTERQRNTLIVCAIIMVMYVVLAYFVTQGSFWTFAAVHAVLAAVAVFFIWLGGAPKMITYMAISLSLVGAATAVAITLWYLTILSNLANG